MTNKTEDIFKILSDIEFQLAGGWPQFFVTVFFWVLKWFIIAGIFYFVWWLFQ